MRRRQAAGRCAAGTSPPGIMTGSLPWRSARRFGPFGPAPVEARSVEASVLFVVFVVIVVETWAEGSA
jgi:hypothetical protein